MTAFPLTPALEIALKDLIEQAMRKVLVDQAAENARQAALKAVDFYHSPVSDDEKEDFRSLSTEEQVHHLNRIMGRVEDLIRSSYSRPRLSFIMYDPVPYIICYPPDENPRFRAPLSSAPPLSVGDVRGCIAEGSPSPPRVWSPFGSMGPFRLCSTLN
ncbi:hypothetical protein, partial [Gluconacetobacter dulcium]|uniref:hypothetical protein n=1 Tax=Gluconacetobacter dulcium TaxID=2729096 RepID=UPI001C815511